MCVRLILGGWCTKSIPHRTNKGLSLENETNERKWFISNVIINIALSVIMFIDAINPK